MELTKIKEKFKRSLLKLQVWFWAAVHSKYFRRCQFRLLYAPIEIHLDWQPTNEEIVVFRIVFNHVRFWFYIPDELCIDFEIATNQEGIIPGISRIDEDDIDDIPF